MANADLLSAAGLTLEDVNGSNWDAISAATEALMKEEGGKLSVIGFDSKLPEFLPLWAKANGVDLISEDGRTAQLDDPAVVEALTWAVSIYDAQGGFAAVKAYRDAADFFGEGNQFATETLGAMPFEQWYVNVLNDVSPDAPMAFDTVKDRQGATLAYSTGSAWALPAGSDNPEAACRWARAMTTVEAWEAAANARLEMRNEEGKPFTGVLTGNAEADKVIQGMVTSGGEPWDTAVAKMYEANDNTFSLPANPADAEFKTALQDAVNSVLNGEAQPEEALDKAQSNAQKALDEAWDEARGRGVPCLGTVSSGDCCSPPDDPARRGPGGGPPGATCISALLFLSPWLVGFLVFTAWPLIYSAYLSSPTTTSSTTRIRRPRELRTLFSDPKIALSLSNTLFFTAVQVPLYVIASRRILAFPRQRQRVGRAGPSA